MSRPKFEVYTDGACSGNPGPGGYGVIILDKTNNTRIEIGGYEENTTNNRMELTAVITAFDYIYKNYGRSDILLISDSKYVISSVLNKWLVNWVRHDYHKSDGSPLPNEDLWRDFVAAQHKHHTIKYEWVKGHSGNANNERCDRIAVGCIKSRTPKYSEIHRDYTV